MLYVNETKTLTNESIVALVDLCVKSYEEAAGKRAAQKTKLGLAIEEILLQFRETYGTDTPCSILMHHTFGKIVFTFRQKGPQINPIPSTDVDDITLQMLVNMDILPKYTYSSRSGMNTVTLVAEQKPQKNKSAYEILGAVALAIICYFLMKLLPESTQTVLAESLIAPVFTKLTFIISAIATPLVFFAIVNGIAEIGDIHALGNIGKKYLGKFMLTYLIAAVTFTVLSAFVYGYSAGGVRSDSGFLKDTIQLVLDIVPNNLIQPFSIDNDLQVVVIAILIGVALLRMNKKALPVKEAFITIGEVVNEMMTIVFKVIPLIVFMGILHILCGQTEGLGRLFIVVILFLVSSAVVVLYVTIRTCRTMKVPFRVLLKKQLPTLMINLTTSSQVSALPENFRCCKEKFGIQDRLVDFGLPIGIVIYMPCGACFLGVIVWALSSLAGMSLNIVSVVMVMVTSVIVAIAAPPIPGSALTVLPIMLSVAAIPLDYYPVAIVFGTLLGYFTPALNGYCLQLEMILIAHEVDMIDEEVLRTPETDTESK